MAPDFSRLLVRELMQTDLTTVPPGMSVRDLTRVLSDNGFSGAPVVTTSGRLVGVVSLSDIVRAASESAASGDDGWRWATPPSPSRWSGPDDDDPPRYGDFFLPEEAQSPVAHLGELGSGELFGDLTVEDVMTPVPFEVTPDTSVDEVAEFLLRGRIHRALVTQDDRLVGIITTMDLLKALVEG